MFPDESQLDTTNHLSGNDLGCVDERAQVWVLGFHERIRPDSQVGNVHEDDGCGLGERAGGFSRLPSTAGRKAADDR